MRKLFTFLPIAMLLLLASCSEKKTAPNPPENSTEAPDSLRFCAAIDALKSNQRAVGSPTRYWPNGRVLKVGFAPNSSIAQIEFVKSALAEWDEITNLSFTYPASGPFDLRWAFNTSQGAYSYIGTDCASIPQSQPTGNVGWGWNSKDGTGKYTDGVARHEVGHALGAMHEQCNGNSGICWIAQNVYADLGKPPNNWDKATVDHNVLFVCDPAKYPSTPWDKVSVMQYAVPARWTCSNASIPGGQYLSSTDNDFWAKVYPAPNPPPSGETVLITAAQRDSLLKWALSAKNESARTYAKTKAIFNK